MVAKKHAVEPKIVVIGAGYAGTLAANRLLRKRVSAAITVVNPRPDFIERVRLHQHISGTGTVAVPLSRMIGDPITVRVGSVSAIGDGTVSLSDGGELAWDHLIYAPGGAVTSPAGTVAVGGFESADAARSELAALPRGATVTVVGGGLTGIETAAEIAESRLDVRVRLVSEDEVGASLGVGARTRVLAELRNLGVELVRGRYTAEQESDLVLWAVATEVSDLAARSGLAVDASGRMLVDQYLRSVTDPRIFGVGDAAAVPGARLACQTAMPQGAHGATNLARVLAGKPLAPYSMGYTGQNVSIGRRQAVVQASRRDDTPTRIWLGGRAAVLIKEQVCVMARTAPRTGIYAWLPAPKN